MLSCGKYRKWQNITSSQLLFLPVYSIHFSLFLSLLTRFSTSNAFIFSVARHAFPAFCTTIVCVLNGRLCFWSFPYTFCCTPFIAVPLFSFWRSKFIYLLRSTHMLTMHIHLHTFYNLHCPNFECTAIVHPHTHTHTHVEP